MCKFVILCHICKFGQIMLEYVIIMNPYHDDYPYKDALSRRFIYKQHRFAKSYLALVFSVIIEV